MSQLDCHLVLGNTYHLENRPGADIVQEFGGLHEFSKWDRAMLTDSGGFQMVSLLHLADITEEGVSFQSPTNGQSMMLTPEHSMRIQNKVSEPRDATRREGCRGRECPFARLLGN